MYGFKECSSCGALYNREHCCSNVSSVDNFVRDPNLISYDETPDSPQQPPRNCSKCGGPFGGLCCRQCTCERCRKNHTDEVCALCCYEVKKSFVNDSNPNSFIDSLNIFNPPPQPQTYSCELCGNDAHYGYDCPPQVPLKPPIFYDDDDDDDEESSIPLRDLISELPLSVAVTPDLPITDSLIMEDEHLNTIPKTESDEVIKSSVDDLVPIPSESEVLSEDLSDIESECDIPVCNDLMTFFNPLFDSNDDFTSSDDESLYDEDVLEENFKIYSNSLFDEEIISTKIDPHHFNVESALIESLLNRDTLIVSSPKFDLFSRKEDIRLVEKSLYDNSSPRPPKKLNSKNSDVVIESFSPSPIPVEDSDSLMEEIDIFIAPDDSIPPGIENDDYDSEMDILFLEELLSNDSLSLPENESFHFDRYYDPSSSRPLAEPPDDGIYFDIEPDMGILTAKVVDDIFEHYVLMPCILPTHPTRCPVIDTLLPFSSENENKVFNSGILASNEEKSPHLLSHRGFKAFQIISNFSNSPMMIYGGDSPILDVPFLHFYPP
ncbi:hypothetical protein Tco_0806659 [Tanacetum coccineum]